MARVQQNVRDAQGGFQAVPAGVYDLKIVEARQEIAKSSNEPKLSVRFEILSGPDGGSDYTGQTILRSYTLQQRGLGFLQRLCVAAGVGFDDEGGFDDEQLMGAEITATVTQREYNGRMQNDVGNEQSLGGAPSESTAEAASGAGGNGHGATSTLLRKPVENPAPRPAPPAATVRPRVPAPPPPAPPRPRAPAR